tara:strand:- start:781 stop:960 length:180 start_codon:yes stop_codon:yes gene_type:complete
MDILIITILAINTLILIFFFNKLSQMMDELDQHEEELEALNYQYFELQKLLKEQLMTAV